MLRYMDQLEHAPAAIPRAIVISPSVIVIVISLPKCGRSSPKVRGRASSTKIKKDFRVRYAVQPLVYIEMLWEDACLCRSCIAYQC